MVGGDALIGRGTRAAGATFYWTGSQQQDTTSTTTANATSGAVNWDATSIVGGQPISNWTQANPYNLSGPTSDGSVPTSDPATALVFSTAAAATTNHPQNVTPNQDIATNGSGGFVVNAITFADRNASSAGLSFTLNGGPLAFSSTGGGVGPAIDENTASAQTINEAIALNASLTLGGSVGGTVNLTGNISGANGLVLSALGTYTLSGSNAYTGGTTLASGTLSLRSANAIGSSGPITFAGGTLQYTATNTVDYSGRFATSAGQRYSIDTNGSAVTLAGSLTSAGATLTKMGAGTLTLTGSDSFTGGVSLVGGTLNVGSAGALGAGGPISFAGGTLQYASANTTDYSGRFDPSAGQRYSVDTNGTSVTFASPLTSSGASLVKSGAGTLTLTASNTFTGGTTLNGGTLTVASTGALGDAGPISFGGGTLQYTAANTTDYSGRLAPGGQAVSLDTNGQNVAFAGNLGSGSFNKSGTGTLTLTGNNTYGGQTTLTGGTLNVGSAGAIGSTGFILFKGGTLQYSAANTTDYSLRFYPSLQAFSVDTNGQNVTFASNMSVTSDILSKYGAGTLTLSGQNAPLGFAVRLYGGTLSLGSAGALGGCDGVEFDGGTLQFTAANTTDYSHYFSTAYNGTYALDTNGQNVSLGSNFLGIQPTLNKLGAGTLTLNAAASLRSNSSTILSGGTLALNNSSALGIIATDTTIFFAGGALRYTANNTVDYSAAIAPLTTAPAAIDTNGQSVSFASPLSHNVSAGAVDGGLTKLGSGTLTLTAASTYTGPTNVSAGTLSVDNSAGSGTGSGSASVLPGGTLGGSGNVSGGVVVGGIITAGANGTSVGTLTTGAQAWNAGGTFLAKFSSATTSDRLLMSGLTISATNAAGGQFSVTPSGPGVVLTSGTSVLIATDSDLSPGANPFASAINTGALVLSGSSVLAANGDTLALTAAQDSGGYELFLTDMAAAPEPTSLMMLGLAFGPLVGRRRGSFRT